MVSGDFSPSDHFSNVLLDVAQVSILR